MDKDLGAAFVALSAYALSLPEVWEGHPWGETAIKVRKRVFVFLIWQANGTLGFTVKLPQSAEFALLLMPIQSVPFLPLARMQGW